MTWWIKWDIGNEFPANGRDEWNRNLVLFLLTASFMIFYTGTKLRNIFLIGRQKISQESYPFIMIEK